MYLLLRDRAAAGRGLPALHKCHGRRAASPLAAAPEEPAVPAEEEKPEEPAEVEEAPAPKAADYDTPNVNPVELGHTEAPRTADGKIDPTQIVDPAVAGDWEEQGCKG